MLGKEEIVSPSLDELKEHYHRILTLLGEDAGREGLQKTPERVAKAMLSLTKGYHMDPHEVLRSAKFQEEYSQMVIVKDIDFFSLCEHHMLPFYGKAHVAYIPNGYITGLSKIARRRMADWSALKSHWRHPLIAIFVHVVAVMATT